MVGYKSISELSLKECYDMLQNERNSADRESLNRRYRVLVEKNQASDNWAFLKCKTIADYENYIKQFDVYYYMIQHKEEAYAAISVMRQEEEIKSQTQKEIKEEEIFWETHKKKYLRRQQYLNKYPNGKYRNQVKLLNVKRSIVLFPLYIIPWLLGATPWILFIFVFCVSYLFIFFLPFIVFFPLADIYNNDTLYMIGFGLFFPWIIGIFAFTKIRQGEYERGERENYSRMTSWLGNLLVLLNEKMDPIKSRLKDRIDSIL